MYRDGISTRKSMDSGRTRPSWIKRSGSLRASISVSEVWHTTSTFTRGAENASTSRGPSATIVGCGWSSGTGVDSAMRGGLPLLTLVSSPSSWSARSACRTVPRSTPNSSANSAWVGRRSPALSCPSRIRSRRMSAISWAESLLLPFTDTFSWVTTKRYNFGLPRGICLKLVYR